MNITWFGHSAFRVELDTAVILIDPFLNNPTFKGDKAAAWEGVTHVALSHGHDDHIGNAVEICKGTGATLIANAEISHYLGAQGVERISPCNHGGTVDHGGFSTTLVPAWHSSSTAESGTPIYLGNPAGIVITPSSGKVIYHMGDTDIFLDMQLINEIYKPQIGMVPIGDRFTMGGKLAALACRRFFDFDIAIPMHYGTFPMLDQTADAFMHGMRGARTQVLVPERGHKVDL